ncbi:hypothetical protein EBR43_01345, partial [bacterium]|nr:hypothetical protein [bacterium]
SCGHLDNADRNAAIVIKKRAINLMLHSGTELTSKGVLVPPKSLKDKKDGESDVSHHWESPKVLCSMKRQKRRLNTSESLLSPNRKPAHSCAGSSLLCYHTNTNLTQRFIPIIMIIALIFAKSDLKSISQPRPIFII